MHLKKTEKFLKKAVIVIITNHEFFCLPLVVRHLIGWFISALFWVDESFLLAKSKNDSSTQNISDFQHKKLVITGFWRSLLLKRFIYDFSFKKIA